MEITTFSLMLYFAGWTFFYFAISHYIARLSKDKWVDWAKSTESDEDLLIILDPLWKDPKTPEMVLLNPDASPRDYRYAGPLTRCQRWETDIVDIESKNGGGIDRAFVLRKMKQEGCDRPGFVEAGEWGRV